MAGGDGPYPTVPPTSIGSESTLGTREAHKARHGSAGSPHPPGFVETTVYCKPCVWKNIPILCSIPAPTANVDINGNGVTAGAYGGYGSYDQVAPAQPGQPGAPGTAGAPGGAPALTLLGHQRSPPPPYRLSRGASVSFAVLDHHQLCYAFGGIREQLVSLGWHG
ncbi:uncharacterized protein GLRG_03031 [Colletotrichum graminicola M1.001]|uniref:Uncharacterized protein n=1 Tax=Colletotrichum graminicola (strain M1.001 / M2 / FGSC 10212) TaxID=645133 RepID=E3QAJ9_COLGM|nr:uncharacterized protein GLRG_03031 [Colletotrichum graminicola M1.001]EFQ27887.1 hypothetical protein GLRG_03031 [Colletotrichum graminicola M1.001]